MRVEPRIIIGFVLITTAVLAADSKGRSQSSTNSMMPMQLVAPLFIEDEAFTSTLVMVNAANVNEFADVSVRGLDGSVLVSRRVDFEPHSQQRLELGALLKSLGSAATKGSIVVMPNPNSGSAIAAALSMTYRTAPQPNYIDEELGMPSMSVSQVLRGVADSGSLSPLAAITSLSESVQHVTIQCLSGDGEQLSKVVELTAGGTVLTEACKNSAEHSDDLETVSKSDKGPSNGPFGMTLTSDAMPGSFAAFALMPHDKGNTKFFSSVLFSDPKTVLSSKIVFVGVPVGPSPFLSEGSYVPRVTLANFSTKDVEARIQYAESSDDDSALRDVIAINVPAQGSTEASLEGLNGDPELRNSFLVTSNASPGDLVAKVVSKGSGDLREVELVAKDDMDPEHGGNHPWSLEDGTQSLLLLFNDDQRTRTLSVAIAGTNFIWRKTFKLKSMQTRVVDIGTLAAKRVRDDVGSVFPSEVVSGEVFWLDGFGHGRGRIVQLNAQKALARNFSCGTFPAPCDPATLSLNPSTISVGDLSTGNFSYAVCIAPDQYSCTGPQGSGSGFQVGWTTGNGNVATAGGGNIGTITGTGPGTTQITATASNNFGTCHIPAQAIVTVTPKISNIEPTSAMAGVTGQSLTINGAGFGSSPTVNLPSGFTKTAQSGGDKQILITVNIAKSATIGVNNISVNAGGQNSPNMGFTVDGPYYLVVNSDIFTPNEDGFGNGTRFINYKVMNFSQTAATGSIPIGETSGSDTGWNCTNHGAPAGKSTACGKESTNSDGTFTDGWGLSGATYTPTGCGFSQDKITWNWCDGATFTHELVVINGSIHTNAVTEFGVTNPPNEIKGGTAEPH